MNTQTYTVHQAAEEICAILEVAATLPLAVDHAIDAYCLALWSGAPAHPAVVLATVAAAPPAARAPVARALRVSTAATIAHYAALREGGTAATTAGLAVAEERAIEALRAAIAAALDVIAP